MYTKFTVVSEGIVDRELSVGLESSAWFDLFWSEFPAGDQLKLQICCSLKCSSLFSLIDLCQIVSKSTLCQKFLEDIDCDHHFLSIFRKKKGLAPQLSKIRKIFHNR